MSINYYFVKKAEDLQSSEDILADLRKKYSFEDFVPSNLEGLSEELAEAQYLHIGHTAFGWNPKLEIYNKPWKDVESFIEFLNKTKLDIVDEYNDKLSKEYFKEAFLHHTATALGENPNEHLYGDDVFDYYQGNIIVLVNTIFS